MNKKIIAFCVAVVMSCSAIAVTGSKLSDGIKTDVSTAVVEQHYNSADGMRTGNRDEAADMNDGGSNTVSTTAAPATTGSSGLDIDLGGLLGGSGDGGLLGGSGGLGDLGSFGSIGEIFGDGSDVIGSIFSGATPSQNNQETVPVTQNPGYNTNYLDPVPAATYVQSQTPSIDTGASVGTNLPVSQADSTVSSDFGAGVNTTYNPYAKPKDVINPGDSGEGVKWVQWILMFTNYGLQNKTIDGNYDEETVEAVKKFQKEQGLTDDGIINEATADKLEILYFQHSMTLTTVAPSAATTVPQTTAVADEDDEKGVSTAVIIAVIAAIWCVAIGVIVAILIIRKKKSRVESGDTSSDKEAGADSSGGEMNLSDLFEEANKE
ncbi:MAG: peptidoglycan-binding protein [Clostridia bacterium]|nr:peptidoglycan-binding protein [Clostridia bacterium]